ncbi:Uncharacterised protein [Amycolatopsis camponoti]|uniref:DUF6292 domain-containing protein n=1 Tax=Amycolatopsis camponoti TaxID=2606593 RepID=A0A6I8M2R3_9PSEU|nr:DUF6292 family protein [Amycolatopsis camponoti]VVJ21815.1 Uncharacterised protein [Amycolatopsis camponoti]
MEHAEPDTRTLERSLGEYVRAVAAAVGVPDESTTVEISDTATAYLGLPRRWLDRPDHDVMLVWSERRGWSLAVETDPAEAAVVLAYQGGGDLVPDPDAVARFVADTAAGRHTGQERPAPVAAGTRRSLAEQLRPYLRDVPEPDSPRPAGG